MEMTKQQAKEYFNQFLTNLNWDILNIEIDIWEKIPHTSAVGINTSSLLWWEEKVLGLLTAKYANRLKDVPYETLQFFSLESLELNFIFKDKEILFSDKKYMAKIPNAIPTRNTVICYGTCEVMSDYKTDFLNGVGSTNIWCEW